MALLHPAGAGRRKDHAENVTNRGIGPAAGDPGPQPADALDYILGLPQVHDNYATVTWSDFAVPPDNGGRGENWNVARGKQHGGAAQGRKKFQVFHVLCFLICIYAIGFFGIASFPSNQKNLLCFSSHKVSSFYSLCKRWRILRLFLEKILLLYLAICTIIGIKFVILQIAASFERRTLFSTNTKTDCTTWDLTNF